MLLPLNFILDGPIIEMIFLITKLLFLMSILIFFFEKIGFKYLKTNLQLFKCQLNVIIVIIKEVRRKINYMLLF